LVRSHQNFESIIDITFTVVDSPKKRTPDQQKIKNKPVLM